MKGGLRVARSSAVSGHLTRCGTSQGSSRSWPDFFFFLFWQLFCRPLRAFPQISAACLLCPLTNSSLHWGYFCPHLLTHPLSQYFFSLKSPSQPLCWLPASCVFLSDVLNEFFVRFDQYLEDRICNFASLSFNLEVKNTHFFFLFWLLLCIMEFPGQGSDLSCSCDPQHSCANAWISWPTVPGRGSKLHPGTAEKLLIPLSHSGNSENLHF